MAQIYIMIYFLISVNTIYEFWYRYEQYKKNPQKTFQEHPNSTCTYKLIKTHLFAKSMKYKAFSYKAI